MKTTFLLVLTLTFYVNTFSQFGTQQIITTDAEGASSVYAIDLDGDGDNDVLSASYSDDTIAWYENTDGQGSFGPLLVIESYANGAHSVFAADIDGDGDNDVLSASVQDDLISWYENTDGQGTFGPRQNITTIADGASTVFAVDIDGDGDIDVLSSSLWDDTIAWYENTDGQGAFGVQQIITTNADFAAFVFASDIDGDGDIDVLSASSDDDKIAWYENTDGQGSFGSQQIISTDADGANTVYAADIDGDGDNDVLSSSVYDSKIAWYENTNGQGNFGSQQIITEDAYAAYSVHATDLDGDGDNDVLSASHIDDKIAWYRNTDAQGSFGPTQVITTNADKALCVFAADINGDGNIDALSASFDDAKIAWYENPGDLGVNQGELEPFSVFPNPTTAHLHITSDTTIKVVEIYTQLGQLVMYKANSNTIDISILNQGLYLIKIKDDNGKTGYYKVLKQ